MNTSVLNVNDWNEKKTKYSPQKVVITDLGEIGENAIVVFEEAVGVGAEEIVCGQVAMTTNIFAPQVEQAVLCIYFILLCAGSGVCHIFGPGE